MNSSELVNRIRAGLSIDDALATFQAACRHRDTLFITPAWFAPRSERLRRGLSEPITAEEAFVLQEVVWQRVKFDDLLAWLDRKPLNWVDYQAWKTAEAERQANRRMEEGIIPWPEVEAARADAALQARAAGDYSGDHRGNCPRCQRPLTWIYFSTPAWTWEALCGRAGWLGLCDPCRLQVQFELIMMN